MRLGVMIVGRAARPWCTRNMKAGFSPPKGFVKEA
jgi:hypothetical protein